MRFPASLALAIAVSPLLATAQMSIYPLRDIRAGQHAIGKTVFQGNKIEDFQVDILGVLENVGPRQSIILAKLSGGPLAETGVMQGMSGSPVYIDGRLVGAVALAFNFSKEPIAGIRPIEEMLAVGDPAAKPPASKTPDSPPVRKVAARKPASTVDSFASKLIDIATPVSFSGFTAGTLDQFAPQLKKLGLEPRQGVASGGKLPSKLGPPAALRPGDMIAVELLSGDMSVGAEGTVTAVDGKSIYAFGHQFMSVGNTELPFARAEVLALLPNLNSSFKISSPLEWMGVITQDRSTSIYGQLGRKADTVPFSITVKDGRRAPLAYHMQMIQDRVLSPYIVQTAVYSAMDATERTLGLASYSLRGGVQFVNGAPPLKLDNTYAGDYNVPLQASTGIAAPLSSILGAGFDALKIKSIDLEIEASERKRFLQVDQITASPKKVHPGDSVELAVTFTGENGVEVLKSTKYRVPVGAPNGVLSFTVSDGSVTNALDYQQMASEAPKSATQLVSFLNNLRPNTNAYVRVWRTDPAFQVQGQDLPDPPPSIGLILAKAQAAQGVWVPRGSKIDELQIPTGDVVVSGSKTAQVEVIE
ncbi:MAG TPA: SpoIVB peptidase S55 domain-containing protein [Bryobacteraceae bacterium]|nr:SpoIVB peptidase S55 domain-containing protein [Bryobacteraceae bacterium]